MHEMVQFIKGLKGQNEEVLEGETVGGISQMINTGTFGSYPVKIFSYINI